MWNTKDSRAKTDYGHQPRPPSPGRQIEIIVDKGKSLQKILMIALMVPLDVSTWPCSQARPVKGNQRARAPVEDTRWGREAQKNPKDLEMVQRKTGLSLFFPCRPIKEAAARSMTMWARPPFSDFITGRLMRIERSICAFFSGLNGSRAKNMSSSTFVNDDVLGQPSPAPTSRRSKVQCFSHCFFIFTVALACARSFVRFLWKKFHFRTVCRLNCTPQQQHDYPFTSFRL